MVSTTNGLERLHEHLKYGHLSQFSSGSMTDLVTVVVREFVPLLERRLEMFNIAFHFKNMTGFRRDDVSLCISFINYSEHHLTINYSFNKKYWPYGYV